MKSQSLKLFATAFVFGLVTIFAAFSASAQTRLSFETAFDFHVGKDTVSAGKYELQRMDYGRYILRNVETEESRIVIFDTSERNSDSSAGQRITFNRYGETYFLRSVFDRQDADGKQIIESGYEKRIRKVATDRNEHLAGGKAKPEKVTVNLKN